MAIFFLNCAGFLDSWLARDFNKTLARAFFPFPFSLHFLCLSILPHQDFGNKKDIRAGVTMAYTGYGYKEYMTKICLCIFT